MLLGFLMNCHIFDRYLIFYEDLPGKEVPNKNVKKEQLDTLARMLKLEFRDIKYNP